MAPTSVAIGRIYADQCSNYEGRASGGLPPLVQALPPDPHYMLALRARHKVPWKLSDNSTTATDVARSVVCVSVYVGYTGELC